MVTLFPFPLKLIFIHVHVENDMTEIAQLLIFAF